MFMSLNDNFINNLSISLSTNSILPNIIPINIKKVDVLKYLFLSKNLVIIKQVAWKVPHNKKLNVMPCHNAELIKTKKSNIDPLNLALKGV